MRDLVDLAPPVVKSHPPSLREGWTRRSRICEPTA